eukprot:CAMPEP_0118675218 /NCGR_PEP_ID=MMETSP0800-20121206/1331_1 /TAXON_ID=210618 ORGANISM="Striatella unipunctata, Strain CCMP2910" /NCGR_SAMPLE_ID=MMETSP0800 /ASSEMBLY_ACC=CAM_ASM_000638 /LENGTH=613 /DNA_ID=CAMNT_0006570519 /DNA_START=46 /DNA_END=1887 /DNA_ORIENTATION=+
MRISQFAVLLLVSISEVSYGKKPVRPSTVSQRSRGGASRNRVPKAKAGRRPIIDEEDEYDEEDEQFRFPGDEEDMEDEEEDIEDIEDEEEEEIRRPPPKRRGPPPKRRGPPPPGPKSKRPPPSRKSRPPPPRYDEDDYDEDDYEPRRPRRAPPKKAKSSYGGGRRGPPRKKKGAVVPYTQQAAGTFTRGLAALRESIPDPNAVRQSAAAAITAAKDTTSRLSSNIYREVKGLTSSELEQVMLKATRPDDTPIKGKHVERLVGVTYQISSRYDIYDAVLRKLWNKMAEKDWRTVIKSLYILHRFSADGSADHQEALKARLRELRRTKDPKRKSGKFFDKKYLLLIDYPSGSQSYKGFLDRYSHYVLLRTQCFGGMFNEISQESTPTTSKSAKAKAEKKAPITSTALRLEHLEAATMLLKAGTACSLKKSEDAENIAIAVERVVSDLIGLTTAVAKSLNRVLKQDELPKGVDAGLVKRWCEFYSESLLPQTRAMIKKTAPKLDAFGLYLPSKMGASVSQELLQKGLRLGGGAVEEAEDPAEKEEEEEEEDVPAQPEPTKEKEVDDEDEAEDDDDEPVEPVRATEREATIEEEEEPEDEALEEDEYDDEYYDDEEA